MNILARFFIVVALFFAFSSSVYARGQNAVYNETYNIGVIAGNIDGGAAYGSVDATGFSLSASNKKAILEYVNIGSDQGMILTGGTWEANISGIYISLLGEGQPYMKFKVGNVKHDMVTEVVVGSPTSTTNSVTSYGIGLGYKMGTRLKLEFDVTTLDNDMTLMSLSVLF